MTSPRHRQKEKGPTRRVVRRRQHAAAKEGWSEHSGDEQKAPPLFPSAVFTLRRESYQDNVLTVRTRKKRKESCHHKASYAVDKKAMQWTRMTARRSPLTRKNREGRPELFNAFF
jgi:hypothetical protein